MKRSRCMAGRFIGLRAVALGTGLTLVSACGERAAAPVDPAPACDPATDASCNRGSETNGGALDTDGQQSAGAFNLCSSMKSNSAMERFAALVAEFCGATGKSLKESENVYTGSGEAKILENAVEELSGQKSAMKLYSSLRVKTTPKAYFAMAKLQFKDPETYEKKAQFKVDENVSYSIKSSDGDKVTYVYENNKEKDKVRYQATTTFVTLKEDEAYAYVTGLDDSVTPLIVLGLKGIVIISKAGEETEVFTLSDQTYDNSGDHEETKRRAIANLKEEQKRHYGNAVNADKAIKYSN